MAGQPLEVKPRTPPPSEPAPVRDAKPEKEERSPGLLPPPIAAPKPTS
jgi:hypothetical protein